MNKINDYVESKVFLVLQQKKQKLAAMQREESNNYKNKSNGSAPTIENGSYKSNHMRSPSNLTNFSLSTCLRERQAASKEH